MSNRKFQPIRTLTKLFSSSQSRTFEQNLKAQAKADAYYTAIPMPRI